MTASEPAPSAPPPATDTAAAAYSDYVNALAVGETSLKNSLESRGVNIITTSGALVTLLFGLVAVLTGSKRFSLPTPAHGYLIWAVILFVAATGLGVIINMPIFVRRAKPTLQELEAGWSSSASEAKSNIVATQLIVIRSARRGNAFKAWLLFVAGILELAALVSLGLAVHSILTNK